MAGTKVENVYLYNFVNDTLLNNANAWLLWHQ